VSTVVRLAPKKEPDGPLRHVSEWAHEVAERGKVQRLQTGIESLDEACRGGIPVPRLVVVGGAPGAGKTTLVVWLARAWARDGVPVAILAADEAPEGIIMRLAQLEGGDAERLDSGDAEEWARAFECLARLPIYVADESATVEAVAGELAANADGHPAVLVVDSIQRARAAGTDSADNPRARVDAVVSALKAVTAAGPCVTLATSELARGAYRSRDAADRIDDLAATKESGSVEYAAQTMVVLRSVPESDDLIEVSTPKNRGPRFRRPAFRLRLDHARASVSEVPLDASEVTTAAERARSGVREDATTLARVIGANPGIGERELRAELRREGHAWGVSRLDAAKRELGARLVNRGPHSRASRWYLAPSDTPGVQR
jgi:KaiC/GvpD/RAD55 family RecA-like ATPase